MTKMFVQHLYKYLIAMLTASHSSCERTYLFQKPSKQFIIGSLADSSKDYVVGSPTGESKVQAKSALRHNSMSLFFLVKKEEKGKISITPQCYVFYKVFPTFKEQEEYITKVNSEDMLKA